MFFGKKYKNLFFYGNYTITNLNFIFNQQIKLLLILFSFQWKNKEYYAEVYF